MQDLAPTILVRGKCVMKKITTIFIITLCLLSFVGLSCLAQESYGKDWNSFSSSEKQLYLLGISHGLMKCTKDFFLFSEDCLRGIEDEEERRMLTSSLKDSNDLLELISFNYETIIDIMDDLYKEPANTNIDFHHICFLACQRLKGESIPENPKPTETTYDNCLCRNDEKVILSFNIDESGKILSLCVSDEQDYIVYRFGTTENIELEYPGDKKDSWNKFTYSYYLRGGGKENDGLDLNYLQFEIGNYLYKVYEEYSANDDRTYVGVKIINETDNNESDIIGDSKNKIGSLIYLRETQVKKSE